MWQLLKAMKRQLGVRRRQKSSRVADESAVAAGSLQAHNQTHVIDRSVGGSSSRLSVLLVIVRAPLAVASCLMGQTDGMEEVWASGEQPRTAEMDHLMVRDSMRYAIYV